MSNPDAQRLFENGNALLAEGRIEEAVPRLEAAYVEHPTAITAQGATMAALAAQDWAHAKHYGRIACKLAPLWAENWHRLGAAYWSTGEWKECKKALIKCIGLDHKHIGAWEQLTALAGMAGDHAEEAYCARVALEARPKEPIDRFHQATLLLWQGRYEEGWSAYEERHHLPMVLNGWRKPMGLDARKRWDGKTPVKRLLVYHEQGHGDAIQMARYHNDCVAAIGSITVLVHQSLVSLFQAQGRLAWDVLPLTPGQPAPEHDAFIGAMSLPHIFGTTIDTVPAPADFGMRWPRMVRDGIGERAMLLPKNRIALCTKGGSVASLDLDRSCHTDAFDRLKSLEGYEVIDFTGRTGSYLDTAQELLSCELLVSVDTSIAHLAGSLGMPVFLVPPCHFEWRHPRGAEVNPWYPESWRYFRRRKQDDWEYAVDNIIQALEAR